MPRARCPRGSASPWSSASISTDPARAVRRYSVTRTPSGRSTSGSARSRAPTAAAADRAAAARPASRSALRSSTFSSPTERRTRPGVTPVVSCCSGVSCECVVDAGWMTSERTSPMFARWLNSVQVVDERAAGVDAALELERQHRADALRGVLVGRRVPRARGQPRVVHAWRRRRGCRATRRSPARSARGARCAATASRCPG